MKYFKKLIGERIYLSPRNCEEVERFTEWLNDFETTDYLGRSSQIYTVENEKKWLEGSIEDKLNQIFGIVSLENDKLIGNCGIHKINSKNRIATLGIFIGDKEARNKGYGTEAINLLLEYGFKYLNLHSIRLDLISVNDRAHKCYKKCGFKDTGLSRESIFLNGKYYDKLHMDILENEFSGEYIRNKNVK